MESFICIQYGKTRYFKHRKYQNLWTNNKVIGDKNAICLLFLPYLLNIYRKFEFLISQGSVATCLKQGGHCHMKFVANFVCFPAVEKFWKSVKIWQSYREFKGENFFETKILWSIKASLRFVVNLLYNNSTSVLNKSKPVEFKL